MAGRITLLRPLVDSRAASLTVVIPLYNEADGIPALADRMRTFVAAESKRREVDLVLVDDGSADATHELLSRRFAELPATILRHSHNRGITAALMTGSGAASGMPLVAQVGGKHQFLVDDEGELPDVNQPIALIDMGCMAAYAAWRRRVDGLPWRLPTLPEMEKAKRGVDGRIWPWGNHFDASWACIATSHAQGRPKPVDVHRFPVDQSVYGVRGLSGNVLHVTLSLQGPGPEVDGDRVVVPDPEAPVDLSPESPVTLMGGLFHGTQKHARSAGRYGVEPTGRLANIGFRLVRSWPAR